MDWTEQAPQQHGTVPSGLPSPDEADYWASRDTNRQLAALLGQALPYDTSLSQLMPHDDPAVAARDAAALHHLLTAGSPSTHLTSSGQGSPINDITPQDVRSAAMNFGKSLEYHNALPKMLSSGASLLDMPTDAAGWALDKLAGHQVTPDAGRLGALSEAGWRGTLSDMTGDKGYQTPSTAEGLGAGLGDFALQGLPFMGGSGAASMAGAGRHMADALPTGEELGGALKNYVSHLYDQAIPPRKFLPIETATTGSGLESVGKPFNRNSIMRHIQDIVAQDAMSGMPLQSPIHRGQGVWGNEANPLYVSELPHSLPPSEHDDLAMRAAARAGPQEGVGPYQISRPLFDSDNNAMLFPRPNRATITRLGKQFGDRAIVADNPQLNGLLMRGYGEPLPEDIASHVRQVLGEGVPVRTEGPYLERNRFPPAEQDRQAATVAEYRAAFPALW